MSSKWYEQLTEEEKASLRIKLCAECSYPFDDNPMRLVCKTCEDKVVTDTEDVYV